MRMPKIQHFSHSQHALRFMYGSLYTCNGCKESGYGFRYECRPCNFDLHESCARAPKSTLHSCHPQHPLVFKERPVSYARPVSHGRPVSRVTCDVCGGKILGFVYECRDCNIDLHPSCAKLPVILQHALHPYHSLQLVPYNSTAHVCNVCEEACTPAQVCNVCGKPCTPGEMSYRCCEGSTPCDFMLHISCAKLPVDPLEEMRMQSISPHEVPRGHMSTAATVL